MTRQFEYTRHARNRLRLYRISRDDVEALVQNPVQLIPQDQDRLNAWGRLRVIRTQTEWLRVTYVLEQAVTVIISVTPRRKGPGD